MSYFWSSEIKIKPIIEARAEVQEFFRKKIGIQKHVVKAATNVINTKITKESNKGMTECFLTLLEIKDLCPDEYKPFFNDNDFKEMMKEIAQKFGEVGYTFKGLKDDNSTLILSWEISESLD